MKIEDIVYSPVTPNGVLIVLREAHKDNENVTVEENLDGNCKWIQSVLCSDETGNQKGRYRNRFFEMLEAVGKDKTDLPSVTFTNINNKGGGSCKSDSYDSLDKVEILDEILDLIKPKIVFLPHDVFYDKIKHHSNVELQHGLMYKNCEKELGKVTIDGVVFYEIYHPSYSKIIDVEKSH